MHPVEFKTSGKASATPSRRLFFLLEAAAVSS